MRPAIAWPINQSVLFEYTVYGIVLGFASTVTLKTMRGFLPGGWRLAKIMLPIERRIPVRNHKDKLLSAYAREIFDYHGQRPAERLSLRKGEE